MQGICWWPDTEKIVHLDRGQTNKQTNKPYDISFRNNKLMWWSWTENITIRCKELGKQTHKYTAVVGENCRVRYYFGGDRRKVTVMRPDVVLIVCVTPTRQEGLLLSWPKSLAVLASVVVRNQGIVRLVVIGNLSKKCNIFSDIYVFGN
jgi:hypothetical protein